LWFALYLLAMILGDSVFRDIAWVVRIFLNREKNLRQTRARAYRWYLHPAMATA
jgi:hypothetical protein